MYTHSYWGKPPTRIYEFIKKCDRNISVCVVGASDGKFVLPFLRKGFKVTAIDIDETAMFGGKKTIPKKRNQITALEYTKTSKKPIYTSLPTETVHIDGLIKRVQKEKLEKNFCYILGDYYRNPIEQQFDVVFTSCSIQYKSNRDIPVFELISTLQNNVKVNGYLYMDYMMPLEDTHDWKCEHFLRTGQIKKYFTNNNWKICYVKEMKKPIFEAAHIDRPEDHFHRFGYILAKRVK